MIIINKESEIWTKIIKPKYPLYRKRQECKGVGDGTPDILLIKKDTRNLYVEAKVVNNLILENKGLLSYIIKPEIRSSQLRWFIEYPNECCFVILVKDLQRFAVIDGKYILILYSGDYRISLEKLIDSEEMLKKLLNYEKR